MEGGCAGQVNSVGQWAVGTLGHWSGLWRLEKGEEEDRQRERLRARAWQRRPGVLCLGSTQVRRATQARRVRRDGIPAGCTAGAAGGVAGRLSVGLSRSRLAYTRVAAAGRPRPERQPPATPDPRDQIAQQGQASARHRHTWQAGTWSFGPSWLWAAGCRHWHSLAGTGSGMPVCQTATVPPECGSGTAGTWLQWNCRPDLFFLSCVQASRRLVMLTEASFC